jgi:hypothetical protein
MNDASREKIVVVADKKLQPWTKVVLDRGMEEVNAVGVYHT